MALTKEQRKKYNRQYHLKKRLGEGKAFQEALLKLEKKDKDNVIDEELEAILKKVENEVDALAKIFIGLEKIKSKRKRYEEIRE